MNTEEIFFTSLLGFIIYLFIWHEIVRSAVSSALKKQNHKQYELLQQQTRLLSELLKNNGIQEQRIIDILDTNKPYFLNKSAEDK